MRVMKFFEKVININIYKTNVTLIHSWKRIEYLSIPNSSGGDVISSQRFCDFLKWVFEEDFRLNPYAFLKGKKHEISML